jgi:hypothetical protein
MSDFEPPIQNLDAFDIVGERLDGGVDLVSRDPRPAQQIHARDV